jgi:hypothetical protein
MGFLSDSERDCVRSFKDSGVLRVYSESEFQNITRNGGVATFCGDGDTDVRHHHERTITNRPHAQEHFGGVLIHSRLFRGYDEFYAMGAMRNMGWGMEAKDTASVFLYPHYPCGVATKFDHSIQEVFLMTAEVHIRFLEEYGFSPGKVHSFFHVKRLNKGAREEQNTYIFDVRRYLSFIGARIVSLSQANHLSIAA